MECTLYIFPTKFYFFVNLRYFRTFFTPRVKRQFLLRFTSHLIKAWTKFVFYFEAREKAVAEFSEWKMALFCGHHNTFNIRKIACFSIRVTRIHTYRIMRHVLFTTYLCHQPNMRLNVPVKKYSEI